MQSALHVTTKILPGHRIEIQSPSLAEGKTVEVFVIFPIEDSRSNSSEDQISLLAQMAEDPEIQAELGAIEIEFSATQMDGLGIL